ncbi:MAG: 50S ribosomal protein L16 [uncultured bacterium]|uniref:Large ribosomal subunit protein uL16 n=4 Tax=Candidatus Daviesiibacteriota TaxID=1752718 RepID=A0A0G0I2R7_9BACT|nr:MAG: 50S ribosomal protein L16 [uncultured bacterium]KKQ10406.1 MAG: 50S ribosomal protein L16 [Candidatus Daviesbacteria bacterium GW2011_GWB1_36_5]KKQ15785.1 MAG: 50S ribosomal protein L16 [Candidatus Daviesbacteria bacterium GW2011_GWA1_36_8]OGE16565.1 MAG: 50S ribosomal protein L16 [Candidatus Daviesbacteria bacterium RIFCSPHIGHO2_01_FULL_36_37]OGE31754.1 MAG: 50S ribosomal protein L16 [Candidatus Daviesbacteria bacterium RIFCSPHIGHO2_02_FULL_37_9]OGE34648.1 MAG: 50S ribosomal protein L
MALLVPSRVKFRKAFRGKRGGVATRGNEISFGAFALKSEDSAWISARQIEAARRAMTRFTQRGGRIWIRIFPDKPITKHPAEARMGSGKGDVVGYVAVVKPGTILFEMGAVTEEIAREAMRLAAHKLPIKTRFAVKGIS